MTVVPQLVQISGQGYSYHLLQPPSVHQGSYGASEKKKKEN